MSIDHYVDAMVSPSQRRPGKWMEGVMQINITRSCDLACSNCTQGSQFAGRGHYMTPQNFELACQSVHDYFGLIGIFGGNPAMHPEFNRICSILRSYFPQEKCGIWCNNPLGEGSVMRKTFNPRMSNLNVHLNRKAYDEFKRDWPESMPFGADKDSRHSAVHGDLAAAVPDETERYNLITNCDINRHWSAMICQFRKELRGFFCEVAGGQAVLFQDDPNYPDTGIPITPENVHEGWWKEPMRTFKHQVEQHCNNCLVPLRAQHRLAQGEHITEVSGMYESLHGKSKHEILPIITVPSEKRRVIDYLEK